MGTAGRKWMALLAVTLILAAAVYALVQSGTREAGTIRPGGQAPDFSIIGLDGSAVKLSDYRGKDVLLNFWASWCGPCVSEMPRMNEAYRTGMPGVEIVAVNVGESRGTVSEFASRQGLAFPVLLDPSGEAARSYQIVGLPTSILIDSDGCIVSVVPGEMAGSGQVKELLRSIRP
ncbi:redoxin family protein [Paenibacillus validus]|uniref:Redoxin domain-containing protein n=1 Tax=Paenibacillus validus TaxID=44253 RepID=A0A7X2Z8Q1_9BACL|nr:redoxin domain-containing protein [Paenibacillus validus]MED4603771.1 redoxin family protein [Paenibacillus validus]MED4608101.1 redoxin family protein [Paenibacillus validus]MUG70369.1 redoxin domain-containing protein [Paenibacillus validus]